MKYMLLIYSDETLATGSSPEESANLIGQYAAYTNEMTQAGVFITTEGLQPIATAATVQVRAGKTLTTHGPFVETKEQLGGFYLIECDNLEQAIAWAEKCPTAIYGQVEVRPVMSYQ